MENKGFDYYAFISYNHKDAKWARQLQQQLEHYRLPAALYKEQPELPKRITPVFLDSSDLVARSSLLESLRAKLDASNYLIVLCSPNSAASPWVNDEVEYFINSGRKDQIIPLIIDGEPHAADPARECCPPALASLSSHEELLGIDIQAYGRRGAFLRIIATLLDLRLDRVIARDAAARRRRFTLCACGLLLLAAAVFSLVWYNTPHTAYYIDYTYVWEKPVGIQEVSPARRRQMDYTYRFTTLRGDVIQVERVNSAGTLATYVSLSWEDPPSMRFYYGTSDSFDGRVVTRVAYYDSYGQVLYEKHYSGDLRALDFVQAEQNSTSFSLGTDLLSSQASISGEQDRGDVIRYIQTYDENGYLIRRMFKRDNRGSSGGTPVRDVNGVWGVSYLRDDSGRIVGTRFLDRDGAFMADKTGRAGYDYAYRASGRISSETCLDLSGNPTHADENVARTVLEYDELGRVVEMARFDLDGGRVIRGSEGASVIRYGYDDRGFMTSTETYDHMLKPCFGTTGVFRTEYTPDDGGWLVRQDFYGPDGQPHPCSDGYASTVYVRSANGQATRIRYFGTGGEPAPCLSENIYGADCTYTDGLLTRIDYLDAQGGPMANKWGAASVCGEYNSERQLSREWYLDEAGRPTHSAANGIAEIRYTYTDGSRTGCDYYDTTGALCLDSCGVASYTMTYESGQLVAESCFGTEGEPVLHREGWHSFSKTYDENGLLLRQCCYGTENERVRANTGYSAISYTYDAAGRVASETFYDTQDRPSSSAGTVMTYAASQLQYEYDRRGNLVRKVYRGTLDLPGEVRDVVYTYDSHGNLTSERWQNYQNELVTNRSGYAYAEADCDAFGRTAESRWYDEEGGLISRNVYEYDSLGRTTRETAYESDGSVRLVTNYVYDELGNRIEKSFTDGDGKPCMSTEGYAAARFAYDSFCNIRESWAYDETGGPREGVFHQIMTHSVTGKTLTREDRDGNDELIQLVTHAYDSYDRTTESRSYNPDGSLAYAEKFTYNSQGEVIKRAYYDGEGNEIDIEVSRAYIKSVAEESPAAEAGLRAGDTLIAYNDWSLRSVLIDPDASFKQLSEQVQTGAALEKHIVVFRFNVNSMPVFVDVTLPADQAAGILVTSDYLYSSYVEKILRLYDEWLELGNPDRASIHLKFDGIG